jgi:hypothetical protein
VGATMVGAPIAAGVFVGAKRIKSNEYARVAGLKTNVLGDSFQTVGQNLKNLRNLKEEINRKKVEKLRKSLSDDSFIKNLENANDQSRRRILTGVLDSFRSIEDAQPSVQILKQSIIDIIEKGNIEIDGQTKELLRSAFRTVKDSNPSFFEDMSRNVNFYKPVQESLSAPLEYTGIKSNYRSLSESELTGSAKSRFGEIKKIIGNNKFDISAVLFDEKLGTMSTGMSQNGMARGSVYAKISSGKQFTMIPIDISNTIDALGSPIVRVGHGQQTYTSPMVFGIGDRIQNQFTDQGVSITSKDISESLTDRTRLNRPFISVEDAFIYNLKDMVEENQGKFYKQHFKTYNESMRSVLENLNRVTADQAETTYALNRSRGIASKMTIILNDIDRDYRRDFSANVISRSGMETLSGHTNLQLSSVNNLNTVNVALQNNIKIKYGEGYKDFVARGVESEYRLSNKFITPSILPLTARPKQFFNTENRAVPFFGKGHKGFGKMALLIDMEGNKRLGLSEGEMYLTDNFLTRKSFPKSVFDPKDMGTGGSDILKELIRRKNEGLGPLLIEPGRDIKIGGVKLDANNPIEDLFAKFGSKDSGGLFLGRLDDKLIEIPQYRDMVRLNLEVVEKTTETGASLLRLANYADLKDSYPKVFSEFAKSTSVGFSQSDLGRAADRYDFERILPGFTINYKEKDSKLLISEKGIKNVATAFGMVDDSLIGKSTYYHNLQMASAVELLSETRKVDSEKVFKALVGRQNQLLSELITKENAASAFDLDQTKYKGQYTQAMVQSVTEFMSGNKIGGPDFEDRFTNLSGQFTSTRPTSAEEVGRVFGSFKGTVGTDQGYGKSGFTGMQLQQTLTQGFKDQSFVSQSTKAIDEGIALAGGRMRFGPDLATQRANQAASEARSLNFIGFRMMRSGMSQDEISNMLYGFLARKSSTGSEIVALEELVKFHEITKGKDSVFDAKTYANTERVTLQNFLDSATSDDTLDDFLKNRQNGFLLDFGEGDTAASRALRNQFTGRDAFYIPAGEDFMKAISSQGTKIIKTDKTIKLPSEYARNLKIFASNISGYMNPSDLSIETTREASKHIADFETGFSTITANAYRNLLRGKMEGSTSLRSAGIRLRPDGESYIYGKGLKGADGQIKMGDDFHGSLKLTKKQASRMTEMVDIGFKNYRGSVIFTETQGFLAAMKDFVGGAEKEYLPTSVDARQAKNRAEKDAAGKFRSFFLGGYGEYAKKNDISNLLGFAGRHPSLSIGHFQESMVMRHVLESATGTNQMDFYLNKALRTERGSELFSEIQSNFAKKGVKVGRLNFESLALAAAGKLDDATNSSVDRFFRFMATSIPSIQRGEGGGRMFIPDIELDVHFGQDKTQRINLSLASAAIGDMDGDLFQLIMPSRANQKSMKKALKAGNYAAIADEMFYRSSLRLMWDEANIGVSNLKSILGEESTEAGKLLHGQIMKEIIHKDVGQIDTALDSIRMGLVHGEFSQKQMRHVQQGFALLTVLEEVGTIKAKKLPIAIDIGKAITSATRDLYSSGDSGGLRRIVDLLFSGTKFETGFDNIKKIDMSAIGSKEVRNVVEQSFKKYSGQKFVDLDEIFKALEHAADISERKLGAAFTKTPTGLASIFSVSNSNRQKDRALEAALSGGMQARMMGKSQEEVMKVTNNILQEQFNKIKAAGSIFNAKMLGPSIAGIVGSLAVVGALTSTGYNAEPLLLPGEITDSTLNRSINQGGMFDNSSRANVSRDPYIERNQSLDMTNRPINTGETYIHKGNSYNISGEINNRAMMDSAQKLLRNIGGEGNFIVNDTRGPISMNYINRIRNE